VADFSKLLSFKRGIMNLNSEESIRHFAERYAAAWCSQDPASVAAFFDEHGSLSVNEGVPAKGRAAIAEVAQGFMSAFPDLTVLLDSLVFTAEGAEFHWTLIGTNSGLGGTGRPVRISGYELWQLGTNGIVNSKGHFDNDDYLRQLGQEANQS